MKWHRRPRRKRGETWELWRVHDGNGQIGPAIGYLVTDRGRSPDPIAYVNSANPTSLHYAKQILQGHGGAMKREGVQRCSARKFIPSLFGMVMVPVNSRGRAIAHPKQSVRAITYIRDESDHRAIGGVWVHVYAVRPIVVLPVVNSKEKRGSSIEPVSSTPASKEGSGARGPMAA